ncbi:TPA: DUF551 domain-containing protein [Escherichia coli]|uniref:DUF551 domain-containing protein n=1 Tax=Escherichia coli TaxID=562 RepID=UPI0016597773|nr:DUF551 domain-containing protein [Escherichia coli]MBC9479219.1 DUF551 domain-containing protein [Escherichia coli]HBH8442193.1 DUF551 domain-containing protein [Escherichia coli]HBH9237018.1 DUF551 domain-containing protein [Escherichia coli]HBR0027148.1 DUF551 domain-containing protein [Escherichia coli]HBV0702774.1 DUF551 domain-containing protein [Escherichia coli]
MTTFTNSKLTDEYVSNATLIRLILWADQHNSHYVVAALRELQERRKADSVPVEINDDMAYAFHHALSDSSLGSDEIEEIKTGLRAAFANVTVQPVLIVPDEIEPDDSNTFDYVDGWNACRAAMLHGAEPVSQTYNLNELSGNSPVTPDSWISCSERMPDDGQHVIILCDGAFVLYAQYRDGEFFDIVRNGDEFFETQSRNVTDWMQLPEPPL